MKYDADRALALLRLGSGIADAEFRDGQEEAICQVVEGAGRLLVVQRTGWGKSFVYFIATKLLREANAGPTLLVSPLLALMRNQILAAERMGVHAVTINSDNREEWEVVEEQLRGGLADIVLVSPERFASDRFLHATLAEIADHIALMVIDEAHCVSDWGHDFRPHYRLIERISRTLPENLRLLATTATANTRVMDDLEEVLGPDLRIFRGDLNRPSLTLQTIAMPDPAERLAWLAEQVPALAGHGIIYALTKRDANRVANWLKSRGLEVEAYTGDSGDRRPELEQALLDNQLKALVATTALGMGFDKPDLGFVIHYQTPGSVVAYYQQVGRAGRAVESAYGILLSGKEDTDITDFFISNAFPTPDEVQIVLDALESEPEGASIPQLLRILNLSKGRIEKTIALLSLESPAPIAKQGSKWQLTAADLSDQFWERADRLTQLRREEQQQMQQYAGLDSGHMAFLIRALDGEPDVPDALGLPLLPTATDAALVQQATRFLRRTGLPIRPRLQWPAGGMPASDVKGRIGNALQADPGLALCIWGDPGWGSAVRHGKYRDGSFANELVEACRSMVSGWAPAPAPTWVTCVPSRRHPTLVPEFAERLAATLGLPFQAALEQIDDRPEQKTMANSTQQALNVDRSLRIAEGALPVPNGPVLLVDDVVDSRWTMTVAAWLLRSHGAGEVWPLGLAYAGHDE